MDKNFVILRIKGNQYKVFEGQEFLVDYLKKESPQAEVLLSYLDGQLSVGKPSLGNVKLNLEVLKDEEKGEKIDILKYRAKSRYRRRQGFRPRYSRLVLKKITG